MSHLVGETVTIKGAVIGRDSRGRPIYGPDRQITGAVVISEGNSITANPALETSVTTRRVSVILPGFYELAEKDVVVVRGLDYTVDRAPFNHRSAFGSSLGGTEVFLIREVVVA